MPEALTNIIIGFSLLAVVLIAGGIAFFIISRSLKLRGQVARSVDMQLFLILMPRDSYDEDERRPTTLEEKVQPMEQLLSVFSGMRERGLWRVWEFGRPHMAWEIVFEGGEVFFYAAVPRRYTETFVRAVHAVYADAVVEPVSDYNIFEGRPETAAAHIVLQRSNVVPIRTYRTLETDPLNSIVTALGQLDPEHDAAVVQIIIQPAPGWGVGARKVARRMRDGKSFESALKKDSGAGVSGPLSTLLMPSSSTRNTEEEESKRKEKEAQQNVSAQNMEVIEAIEAKAGRHVFATTIRLVTASTSEDRAESLLGHLESTMTQFASPNLNQLKEVRDKRKRELYAYSFRLFNARHASVLSTEEIASLVHPPLPGSNLPNVRWLTTRSAAAPGGMDEGLLVGVNEYRGKSTPVRLSRTDRMRHLYIIGQTGVGKTGLLENIIKQDIENGEGVCVIDPHGDLIDTTLGIIPKERQGDVVLFDPTDVERPFGLNMLEYNPAYPEQKTFIIDEMIHIFDTLYDLKSTGGPMFEQYTRNALLLLMDTPQHGYTLLDVPRVLADSEFRSALLRSAQNPTVRHFWEKEAEKAGGEAALANIVPYITSKFNAFTANDFMRPIVGQSQSSANFRQIMDEGKIVLVRLSKGRLGEINMRLLGLIVIGKLMAASFSRADQPEDQRRDFYLHVDEFHNFTTDSISTILSEARKYRLSLTLAHQFIAQIPENISKAVFGNVGNMMMLRVGQEDAEFLAQYLKPAFTAHDLVNLDNFHAYAKLMVRGQTTAPFNVTLNKPPQSNSAEGETVKNLSRLRYGKDYEVVAEEINRRFTQVVTQPDDGSDEFSI